MCNIVNRLAWLPLVMVVSLDSSVSLPGEWDPPIKRMPGIILLTWMDFEQKESSMQRVTHIVFGSGF